MPKHTKGPWEWVIENGDIEIRMGDAIESPYSHSCQNSFIYVDMIESFRGEQKEQAIANANLMAAAPELLEKLEIVLELSEEGLLIDGNLADKIADLVKKAKGAGE